MSDNLEIVRTVAPFVAPLTGAIIDTWLKPKMAALRTYLKTDKALFENALASKFDEYLQRAYEKNSHTSVIVFQNQQKKLEDIYIPLTVVQPGWEDGISIDSYRSEFVPTYRKVLIKDTAGMGKSTALKYLFISCVKQNVGIPILIELRKLKGGVPIVDYICNELSPIDEEVDKDFILKLITKGDFIFFLDGYDEIPLSQRNEVTDGLQDFISKAGNNLFILASRPESSLASFSDFREFNIKPLEREEAFELLRKYDPSGKISEGIIEKLEDDFNHDVEEFLENPLLVSLLFKSYEYKPVIHLKKHIFYRQVYDALFESHDLTKGGVYVREKHSQLNIEDFHRVLRALGFITVKLGQVEFDKDALLSHLSKAKERCPGITFKESDFFTDLLTTVPLFNRDGNYYRWSHKSIQEYFAAQFIWLDVNNKKDAILRHMAQGEYQFENVLDLYYEMDYKTFRRTLIYDLISAFLKYLDSSYTLLHDSNIRAEHLTARKILTFGRVYISYNVDELHKLTKKWGNPFAKPENFLLAHDLDPKRYDIFARSSIGLLVARENTDEIRELLSNKKEAIFLTPDEYEKYGLSAGRAPGDWISKGGLVTSENPDSVVNQPMYFEQVNNFIFRGFNSQLLSPDKCRLLKADIENEIEREMEDDII